MFTQLLARSSAVGRLGSNLLREPGRFPVVKITHCRKRASIVVEVLEFIIVITGIQESRLIVWNRTEGLHRLSRAHVAVLKGPVLRRVALRGLAVAIVVPVGFPQSVNAIKIVLAGPAVYFFVDILK